MPEHKHKHKRLKPDSGYGARVNGYSDRGQELKQAFLNDARALLKEVSQHLAARGLTCADVCVHPGGVADYWQAADPSRRVYVNISDSALGWGRKDALVILARVQHYRLDQRGNKESWHRGQSGPNQWLSANFGSRELADRLWRLFQPETTPAPKASFRNTTMMGFTSGGEQAIPNPVVANDEQAAQWAVGMAFTIQAFAADNEQALAATHAPVAISLFNRAPGGGNEIEARLKQQAPMGGCKRSAYSGTRITLF